MSNDCIEYLKKYLVAPSIESLPSIGADAVALPEKWIDILSVEGIERITRVMGEWTKFERYLPDVVARLRGNLKSVDLLKNAAGYSLLYSIDSDKRILYYEAKNPLCRKMSENVKLLWPQVPESLRNFYDFHDGFYYLASHSNGLSPTEDIRLMADDEWGILDDIPEPPIDMNKSMIFFNNGGSGYVFIDLSHPGKEEAAVLWWSNDKPTYDVNFWSTIDAWTAIGMEG